MALNEDLKNFETFASVFNTDVRKQTFIATELLRLLSIPPRLIMHHSVGERSFGALSVLFHLLCIAVFGSIMGSLSIALLFAGVFLVAVLAHTIIIKRRIARGDQWHSRSLGRPYKLLEKLPFAKNYLICEGIIEPVLFSIIFAGLLSPNLEVGSYFIFLSFVMYVQVIVEIGEARAVYLDQVDNKLEGEAMRLMLSEDNNIEKVREYGVKTSGTVVGALTMMSPQKREKMLKIFRQAKENDRKEFKEQMSKVA